MYSNVQINNINNIMNKNIYERNVPDRELQPLLSPIPISTKYNKFSITNNNTTNSIFNNNTTNKQYEKFNIENNFNPGSYAPVNYYLESIDVETNLRNQHLKNHKYNENCWIPNSNNNLYKDYNPYNNVVPACCNDPYMSNTQTFAPFNPNYNNRIGNELFNNNTRIQLKSCK